MFDEAKRIMIKQEDVEKVREAYDAALDDPTFMNNEEAACQSAWGVALSIVMNRHGIVSAFNDLTSEMMEEAMHLQMLAIDD